MNILVHKSVRRSFFPWDQNLEVQLLSQRVWMKLFETSDTLPNWPPEKVCPSSIPCSSLLYCEELQILEGMGGGGGGGEGEKETERPRALRAIEMGQDNEQERPDWLGNSLSQSHC